MASNPAYRNPEGRPVVGPWQCPCKECTAPQESTDDQTDSLVEADAPCICFVTPEEFWFRYGSAVEPGSQMEPNPECPVHFPEGPPCIEAADHADYVAPADAFSADNFGPSLPLFDVGGQ